MMNHSFEHLEAPEAMLVEISRLLLPGHALLIRVPVAGKHAWREYGPAWVALDAPRHHFLHTEQSIRLLAERTGFELTEVRYDSTGFQFWASEQYRQDIPLADTRSHAGNPKGSIFTRKQIAEFDRRAAELNARGEGDTACFYLTNRRA
jgi:hypothetical protein